MSRGWLRTVGHGTLGETNWLEGQFAARSADGIRLAMVSPCLVAGKRLSHPELDQAWLRRPRRHPVPRILWLAMWPWAGGEGGTRHSAAGVFRRVEAVKSEEGA